ncbi:hypothetical protein SNEBB_000106 [Seison nebaliae]|nr:hypothetical protein SNEBB_000106 [Seison nebaliae]
MDLITSSQIISDIIDESIEYVELKEIHALNVMSTPLPALNQVSSDHLNNNAQGTNAQYPPSRPPPKQKSLFRKICCCVPYNRCQVVCLPFFCLTKCCCCGNCRRNIKDHIKHKIEEEDQDYYSPIPDNSSDVIVQQI